MNPLVFFLIFLSISCSAVAQLLLKKGMSHAAIGAALEAGNSWNVAWLVATNPWVVAGLSLYFIGAVMWLFVLARVEVSFAYPFVGLGFILTLLLGKMVMGDAVSSTRIAGTLLVSAGVLLIART